MEIKNPQIVTCTQKIGKEVDETSLIRSIKEQNFDLKCVVYEGNIYPLSREYNMAIKQALIDDVDCLILVHDDVILEEDPIPKLEKLFDDYDLVGVAGTSKIELKSPALWHFMGGGFENGNNPSNLHGRVQHIVERYPDNGGMQTGMVYKEKIETNFGFYPHRVVMIDGVFMALNRKAMETVRFDEGNPCGFHFYDLDFSLNAHLNGLKVGVGDILITHESPGLREFTEDWRNGERWFISKYAG
jgi:GT2 family glycosyltransferase